MRTPVRPDLIVLAKDTPKFMLVVELKGEAALEEGTTQLRQYMLATRCPIGLMITPQRVRILRDSFMDYTDESIQIIGEIPTPEILAPFTRPDHPRQAGALHQAVEAWLERLASSHPSALPTVPSARRLIEEFVMPAVTEGRILAEPNLSGG